MIELIDKLKSKTLEGKVCDYAEVDGAPIIEADLTTATLTANTYYKHTGATGAYTTGVIYYYNGSSLKPIDGSQYTLPLATSSAVGGIKSTANRTTSISPTTGGTTSGRYYGVELDNDGTAFVNVPWTDTKVTQTKTTSASSMPLLLAPAGQTATTTTTANFTNNIYAVPSTGRLYVTGGSNPLFGLQATNGTAFFLQAQTDKLFLGPTSAKALTFTGSTGAISMPNNLTVSGKIYEGGKTLSDKYLGVSAVSVTQKLTSGTEIGSVTINGTATKLYAPASGLGSQEVEDIVDTRLEDYVQTQALEEGQVDLSEYGFATSADLSEYVPTNSTGDIRITANGDFVLDASNGNDTTLIMMDGVESLVSIKATDIGLNGNVKENGTLLSKKYASKSTVDVLATDVQTLEQESLTYQTNFRALDDGLYDLSRYQFASQQDIDNLYAGTFDLSKYFKELDTFYQDTYDLVSNECGVSWNNTFGLIGDKGDYTGKYWGNVPIVAGDNVSFTVDEENQVVKVNADLSAYSTKTYVDNAVSALVDSSPETLNTLNELAAALGDDPNFAATVSAEIGKKQATITGAATTITSSNLTASRALVSDANGKVAVSAVTSTELGYLDGVTSAIQTQLNGKLSTTGKAASATVADSANAVAWSKVSGKPTFATVATSGNYNDLSNKPTIPTTLPASDVYAWAKAKTKPSYSYSEITGKPTLATVATSGNYNDLTNKPTIPSAYTLPVASSTALGGIKIGYTATGANIPLQLSSDKAYVALTKSAVTSALGYTPPTTDTTYSVATASKAGLVKPVSVITKPTLNSVTTTSGKYYQVQMSSDGNMFVNVPWQAGSSVDLSSYATLASPTFTGTPKAPTAAKGTNTTQIATTAFVKSQGFVTSEALDDLVDKQDLEGGTVNLSAYNFASQKDNPNLTYYATDNGTTTAGTWLGKNDNVTALFDGLSVNYKVTKAGASTTTFNLNGLGAKTVYLRGTTKLTTHYEVGTIVNMIYNSTTGAWYVADYDANSYAYLRQYYTLTNTDGEYPIIYSYTKDTGTSSYKTAYGAVKGGFTFNPYNNALSVGNINLTDSYLGMGALTISKGDDWADISINGQESGISMGFNENGDAYVDLYGTVTVNGEPIGSGGGANTKTPYATSSTASGTAAKVATISNNADNFSLAVGQRVAVKFTYASTVANPTLNVNSTGAKAIYGWDYTAITATEGWGAGDICEFMYNGTYWIWMNDMPYAAKSTSSDTTTGTKGAVRIRVYNGNLYIHTS